MRLVLLLSLLRSFAHAELKKRPNLLFLHDESTDGRTYQRDMAHLVPIPHLRSLQDRGVNFLNFYCNVPICAPSRASVWSGRQPHNGLHTHNNITVRGYWNNYEGGARARLIPSRQTAVETTAAILSSMGSPRCGNRT